MNKFSKTKETPIQIKTIIACELSASALFSLKRVEKKNQPQQLHLSSPPLTP